MPLDEKLLSDLSENLKNIDNLRDWLNKLYYNEQFAGLFNQTKIGLLDTGAQYLQENLRLMRQKYQARFDEIENE